MEYIILVLYLLGAYSHFCFIHEILEEMSPAERIIKTNCRNIISAGLIFAIIMWPFVALQNIGKRIWHVII